MTMVSSKAGLVTKTNPQTDDLESSKMDELEARVSGRWKIGLDLKISTSFG